MYEWDRLKRSYKEPAKTWNETVPIGNGRLGASIYGAPEKEHVVLNEDTLWSGGPDNHDIPNMPELLAKIRTAVFNEDYGAAETLTRRIKGPATTSSYEPLADLYLEFQGHEKATDYLRELDLDRGIVTVTYRVDDVIYTRKMFASHPDQVIVVQLTADTPGSLSLDVCLESQLWHKTVARDGHTQVLIGKAPAVVDRKATDTIPVIYATDWDGDGMTFEARLQVCCEGGDEQMRSTGRGSGLTDGRRLYIRNADRAVLVISAITSFKGWDTAPAQDESELASRNQAILDAACAKFLTDRLEDDHVADHRRLFRRLWLEIDTEDQSSSSPGGRAEGPHRAAAMLQYARYLVIAGSRPGTQPLNLQRIWNDALIPPWNANYTLNENTEKHYFSVETANLAECHEPLIKMVEELAVAGRETAQRMYNCRGWVTHHNTDLWRLTVPVGRHPKWFMWPFGGVWLTLHLWEHYAFSQDIAFLRDRAYPLMQGAAEFLLDWLIEDEDGFLVTAPSTSPENLFYDSDGSERPVCKASTADMVLTRELFRNVLESAADLGIEDAFTAEVRAAVGKLYPLQVGSKGQLLEWPEEFEDVDPHHRHASHLLGLWPGRMVNPHETPEWFAAAHRSLELRENGATLPDKAGMWARLRDAEKTERHLPGASAAAIIELLLQSHAGEIELLPALPQSWSSGAVSGLRARGGFEVGIQWRDNELERATIRNVSGPGTCRVRYADSVRQFDVAVGREVTFE
ncbi:MAG: glycoside hydrolase family 95 protein [Candidatus Pacebacteria bacterium]|nr:glycoside hydrolase family 95 protein [Candidatus Paceibacterota bacterium]